MVDRGRYRRVVIKLSGESLGADGSGVDPDAAAYIVDELTSAHEVCPEMGVVVGAGNLVRGAVLCRSGIERICSDQVGMVGTVLNALVLRGLLAARGIPVAVYSAFPVGSFVSPFSITAVRRSLAEGQIVVFAGGTGNPLFTTDSAAALRALEIEAQCLIKATTVNGVYSADPKKDATAKLLKSVSFFEVLEKRLRVMDWTAVSLCMEHGLPLRVFRFDEPGALRRLIEGEDLGTLIS